jgi:hypothetical protein
MTSTHALRRFPPSPDSDGTLPRAVIVGLTSTLLFVFLVAEVFSGQAQRVPMFAVALSTLIVSQVFVPSARPSLRFPLSPRNWAIFAFLLQLLVIPVLILLFGPAQSVLPYMPSDRSINEGLLLEVAAYVGLLLGLVTHHRLHSPEVSSRVSKLWAPPAWIIGALAAAGLIGVGLRFGSWQGLVNYVRFDPSSLGALSPGSASLRDAAATVLLPLLGFAVILIWCTVIDTALPGRTRRWWMSVLVLSAAVVVASSVFRYERGPAFVAVIGMLSAFSVRIKRIPYRALVAIAAVGLLLVLMAGSLRSTVYSKAFGVRSAIGVSAVAANRQVQIYANGAQFAGFTIDMASTHHRLYLGGTILPSLLYPVPILGKPFRSNSGPTIYNKDIYGNPVYYDQILPFSSELYWNFNVPGVIIGFLIIGYAIAALDGAFVRSASARDAFVFQYVGVWIAFLIVGSLAVVSQMALYFMWPMAALYLTQRLYRNPKTGPGLTNTAQAPSRAKGPARANPFG